MTSNHETNAVRRRNRGMLIALFLMFFGGMLVAGILRFSGWRPEGSKNKGELLQPYGDLREYAPTLADGGAYRWKDSPRTWRIVAMPRDCDAARAADCMRLLADLDKVWQLMGKDADRVHVLWAGAAPTGVVLPQEVHALRVDDGLRAGLARWNDAAGDAVWLLDPNGFVVLRYAPGFDPGDLRTDLARLLKIN
ncbi:hypothetical protein [Thermomonas sp. HDW16]|uniref:hypothetical protein n=1 Tax=Thermomonas sp. HDW16 TaxID=2714945 RepID=UPI0014096F9D|nr:hypothetical protein [Thermomonas sp. HDW16]QIL19660.1 hypothetical protein G7079_02355 [Thermomonas sp. HDW16]